MVVNDLAVSYGAKPALHHVDLSIHRNCITAIIGPSGCGKSTFLTCLNRMTDLVPGCRVGGRVAMDQTEITNGTINLIALRRRVGMIFQKPHPLPLSIRKNLAFPLKQHGLRRRSERDAEAEIALRRVGLWDEVKDRLNTPASGLSGGQQQRLCIARSLALDPKVLLMDEPCSALDPIASGVVEDLIVSLRGNYTVVVVTHNLAQARRIADDMVMFWVRDGAGTVVEAGSAQQVFESPRSEITAAYLRGERG
jgi:phosphate transport system ATP-binding protein